MIILLADTFFFNFIFGLNWKLNNTNDNTIIREINSFKRCLFPPDKDAEARYWWLIVVWATAATAIHNMQQEPRPWPGCEIDTGKLKIYEDPLAYLGILVDILEEWDRYSVMRRTFFTDYSPVQSKDIILTANNDKIEIKYDNIERGEKVIKSLDTALHSWRKIIKIVK